MQSIRLIGLVLALIMALVILFGRHLVEDARLSPLDVKIKVPMETYLNLGVSQYSKPSDAIEFDPGTPEKVKEAFKSTIVIKATFLIIDPRHLLFGESLDSTGTAFMVEPGIFMSARHIFLDSVTRLQKEQFLHFSLNDEGFPESPSYRYYFVGTADIGGKLIDFPLDLFAIGDPNTFQDMVIFKADGFPKSLKSLELSEDFRVSDKAYSAGRVPLPDSVGPFDNLKRTQIDLISYIHEGTIGASLDNMEINNYGVEKVFRIITNVELGFSGGPVFTVEGKVGALTRSVFGSFSYAISAKDLKKFINKARKDRK